ncbi:FKBP-type peptidyl-prolyl cis-trans isomerase [Rubrolithibacter danxiaensis]|uniref:FKBP-type peptidyl-prolyl cis-trans isomerase n=1 Tax=Rubrolithibacter danxiaensis TaxID=3390805 RepID=UPI003BF8BAD4
MKFFLLKAVLFVAFIPLLFSACEKEYTGIEQVDEQNIQEYIKKNSLGEFKTDSSGIYYKIIAPGNGDTVHNTDKVYFTYTIKTFNGEYNSSDEYINRYAGYLGYVSPQTNLPEAFRFAIGNFLKQEGGTIRVIIPSRLAFGRNETKINGSTIPSNSSLDCTVTLLKKNNLQQYEDSLITQYMQKNSLTGYTKTASGLYYKIADIGTGSPITIDSTVSAAYTGRLLNGTVFETVTESSPGTFDLNDPGLRKGWKETIPLIKGGGSIRIIFPSSLGYGLAGYGTSIPPFSPLDFDIKVTDVKQND